MSRYEQIPVLPEPSGTSGMGGRLVAGAVACLTVLAALAGYQRLADRYHDPRINYLSDRFELARRAAARADVVFIGTSVVYRDIDTGYLNELSGSRGCGLEFLNLGVPAMSVSEFKLLLGALGLRGSGTRIVAFNPTLYDGMTSLNSRRAAWSNRVGTLGLAWQSVAASKTTARRAVKPEHEGDGLRARLEFARHWILSSLRVGEAAHWLLRDTAGEHYVSIRRRHLDNAGFLALEDDPRLREGRDTSFRSELESWQRRVESIRDAAESFYRGRRPFRLAEPDQRFQDRLIAEVRASGSRPVAVFPPQLAYQHELVELYRQKLGEQSVLDFGFHAHPEFMDHRLWYDRAHLNREGSRLLGERIFAHFCDPA